MGLFQGCPREGGGQDAVANRRWLLCARWWKLGGIYDREWYFCTGAAGDYTCPPFAEWGGGLGAPTVLEGPPAVDVEHTGVSRV